MSESPEERQRRLCEENGVPFTPPEPGTKVGIALQTLGRVPVFGIRLPPEGTTCGWYIHAGEFSDADDFYQPVCVEHLPAICPAVVPFLGLPPRWRFLTDYGGYVDVWTEG